MQENIKIVYKMLLNDDPFKSVTPSSINYSAQTQKDYYRAIDTIKAYLVLDEPCRASLWTDADDRSDYMGSLKVPYQLISTLFTQASSEELKWLDSVLNPKP